MEKYLECKYLTLIIHFEYIQYIQIDETKI